MSNFQGIYGRAFEILSSSLNSLVVCDFPPSGGSTIQILLGRSRTLCLKNPQTQSSGSERRFVPSQPSASGVSSLIFSDSDTEAATCSFRLQPQAWVFYQYVDMPIERKYRSALHSLCETDVDMLR